MLAPDVLSCMWGRPRYRTLLAPLAESRSSPLTLRRALLAPDTASVAVAAFKSAACKVVAPLQLPRMSRACPLSSMFEAPDKSSSSRRVSVSILDFEAPERFTENSSCC